jgi:hypothetical protein
VPCDTMIVSAVPRGWVCPVIGMRYWALTYRFIIPWSPSPSGWWFSTQLWIYDSIYMGNWV